MIKLIIAMTSIMTDYKQKLSTQYSEIEVRKRELIQELCIKFNCLLICKWNLARDSKPKN